MGVHEDRASAMLESALLQNDQAQTESMETLTMTMHLLLHLLTGQTTKNLLYNRSVLVTPEDED